MPAINHKNILLLALATCLAGCNNSSNQAQNEVSPEKIKELKHEYGTDYRDYQPDIMASNFCSNQEDQEVYTHALIYGLKGDHLASNSKLWLRRHPDQVHTAVNDYQQLQARFPEAFQHVDTPEAYAMFDNMKQSGSQSGITSPRLFSFLNCDTGRVVKTIGVFATDFLNAIDMSQKPQQGSKS